MDTTEKELNSDQRNFDEIISGFVEWLRPRKTAPRAALPPPRSGRRLNLGRSSHIEVPL
jgi:hypothetical protein